MAKSIYEILDDLQTETSVPAVTDKDGKELRPNHGSVAHTIPRSLFPDSEIFESETLLESWANENGFTHALLQMGLTSGLIDIRAIFKSMKKNETWTIESGQAKVDSHEWKVMNRPNVGGSKNVAKAVLETGTKLARAMAATGMDVDAIKPILAGTYKPDEVEAILTALNE